MAVTRPTTLQRAEELAATMPTLLVAAERVASTVAQGVHDLRPICFVHILFRHFRVVLAIRLKAAPAVFQHCFGGLRTRIPRPDRRHS